MELKTIYNFLDILKYGKFQALTVKDIYTRTGCTESITTLSRKCRAFAHEARLNGHWVIGDESGYYKAADKDEWDAYKKRRFNSIGEELHALANCDRISVKDLIKNIYAVKVDDPNYHIPFQ